MLPETIVSVTANSIPDGLRAARRALGVQDHKHARSHAQSVRSRRARNMAHHAGGWHHGGSDHQEALRRNDQPCGIHGPCQPDLLVVNNSIMRGEAWRRVSLPRCRWCSRIDHTPCGNGVWLRVCKRHAIEAGCRSASCRCAPDYASPRLPCGEKVGTNCVKNGRLLAPVFVKSA